MKLVKLKRQSKDIGLFGKKGVGKTTLLVLKSFMEFMLYDAQVYSNFNLGFPHVRIKSLKDFDRIPNDDKRKVFLGDDFEFWFNSRNVSSKLNKDLVDVLLNWGKKNVSLVYSAKREMAIDKSLRESTIEFWELNLKQTIYNKDVTKNNILKKYLNFLYIEVERYDQNLDGLPSFRIKNLQHIVPLFDTKEIIDNIITN